MSEDAAEIAELLEALSETPRRLASMTAEVEPGRLQHTPGPDEWSMNDILAHLRSCADIWGKGITAMLTNEHPTMRYVSPRTWIRKTDYPKQDFRTSLQVFTQQRAELLTTLQGLALEDWSRAATFNHSGKPRVHTVIDFARRLASHEVQHIAQLEATLNADPTL